mmetsp:Transcript_67527/g.121729  ORF Transcript_67527/g.121729 Transcript_67527/m.121729 type:complete len:301 (+) Transcript_67527:928-1830(+)
MVHHIRNDRIDGVGCQGWLGWFADLVAARSCLFAAAAASFSQRPGNLLAVAQLSALGAAEGPRYCVGLPNQDLRCFPPGHQTDSVHGEADIYDCIVFHILVQRPTGIEIQHHGVIPPELDVPTLCIHAPVDVAARHTYGRPSFVGRNCWLSGPGCHLSLWWRLEADLEMLPLVAGKCLSASSDENARAQAPAHRGIQIGSVNRLPPSEPHHRKPFEGLNCIIDPNGEEDAFGCLPHWSTAKDEAVGRQLLGLSAHGGPTAIQQKAVVLEPVRKEVEAWSLKHRCPPNASCRLKSGARAAA